jgi:hypothetical protein
MSPTQDKEKNARSQRKYYAAHREEITARARARHRVHTEKDRARGRAYAAAHPEVRKAYLEAHREEFRAWQKKWYLANREKINAQQQLRNSVPANRERIKAYCKAYYIAKGREKAKAYRLNHPEEGRARYRIKHYDLSPAEYDAMFLRQGGACAICKKAEWNSKGPYIDHDHVSGKVRGILCHRCNTALGHVLDDPIIAQAMTDYLKKYRVELIP